MWWHYVSVGAVFATFVIAACFLSYFFQQEEPSNSDEFGYTFGGIHLVRHIFKAATPVRRARKITKDLELVLPLGASSETALCAICLEPAGPEGFRELSCKHAYHLDCIKAWCEQHVKKQSSDAIVIQCPMCRSQQQIPIQGPDPSDPSDPSSAQCDLEAAPVRWQL
eukprot:Skav220287  [mRNA]  locus=scaffold915:116653:118032:+ [translate_table: standard]